MTYEYRIFEHETKPRGFTFYTLNEVYVEHGKPSLFAETFITGDSIDELIDELSCMLKDAKKCRKKIEEDKEHLLREEDFEEGSKYHYDGE